MTQLAPGMPNLPPRFTRLPIDHRGFPVPKFVYQRPDGTYDFRVIKPGWREQCIRNRLCWQCGAPIGRKYLAFITGPMCACVSRTCPEFASHKDCALFAVQSCPFLRFPNRKRDENDLPDDARAIAGDEAMIRRNPGVAALWVTRDYELFRAHDGTVMITIGDPIEVTWWAHGRKATRDEVMHSIETGLPILRAMAEKDGKDAVAELEQQLERGLKLVPAA
jgi:hypothetical protein